MPTKSPPRPPKGVKLEERYGAVSLKAVAGAIKPAKPAGGK